MLGSTGGLVGSSGDAAPDAEAAPGSSSIMSPGGGGGGDFYEGDRSSGGNRWPRQETLALLKIRSDMDGVFRDSNLKGPLWEEVSRKMAELGYHRSSKKCKEKFENVYKYHKRTKDGRVGKSDGKTYRFFDQLEAFEQHQSSPSQLPPLPPVTPRAQSQPQLPVQAAVPVTMVFPAGMSNSPARVTTVTSSSPHSMNVTTSPQHVQHQIKVMTKRQLQPNYQQQVPLHVQHSSPIQMGNASSPSGTLSSSSSTSSDEEVLGRRKRKRKWKDFFEGLMKEVIVKQEELQAQFLEAVERREHDRLVREEAWKAQELGRLNREHEILVQERSKAAAKDAALIELLKKLSEQHQIPMPFPVHVQPQPKLRTQVRNVVPVVTSTVVTTIPSPPPPQPEVQAPKPISQVQAPKSTQFHLQENPGSLTMPAPASAPAQSQTIPQPQPQPLTQIHPQQAQHQALALANTGSANVDMHEPNNGGENQHQASSSRWPKPEVEALIKLRTKMDEKYQENCPKGPLWEEISTSMKQLGYNRNAKRCKEKWENINKYFKKVKESNKKRPEDSKTCPYFHQLDALYRNKTTIHATAATTTVAYAPLPQQAAVKPENLNTMGPIMAQPVQHWRHPHDHRVDDAGSGNDTEDDDDGDDDDDDDDQGSGYEIVANNGNNNNNNGDNRGVCSMGNSTAAVTTATTTTE